MPNTVSDSSNGDTVNVHRNAAHASPLRVWSFHCRHPSMPAAMLASTDMAAMTSTHLGRSDEAMAAEIPASHRMWPTTNPPIPATQIALN